MAAVASLATLENGSGDPYASLITVATETDGSPVILISKLAWHTRNLEADPRASILFAAAAGAGDPLDLGRVSLMGVAERTAEPAARARFLARHPSAALYADFADFSFWRLRAQRAHYVGGFGRITTLKGEDVMLDQAVTQRWTLGVEAAIAAANAGQADLIAGLAGDPGPWRVAACDPDGCDLLRGDQALRLAFPQPLSDPSQLVEALTGLSRARSGA